MDFFGSDGFGEFVWTTERSTSSQTRVQSMKTFKMKMAGKNALFANLLALIASLIACIKINFAILTPKISHFKEEDSSRLWNFLV